MNEDARPYIEPYRAQESPLAVAMLVDDSSARRVLVAWVTYAQIPAWVAPDDVPPDDERKRWHWLWTPVLNALNYEDLGEASGMTAMALKRKLAMLVNARLIYPDGTISKHAEAAIRMKTAAAVPRGRK